MRNLKPKPKIMSQSNTQLVETIKKEYADYQEKLKEFHEKGKEKMVKALAKTRSTKESTGKILILSRQTFPVWLNCSHYMVDLSSNFARNYKNPEETLSEIQMHSVITVNDFLPAVSEQLIYSGKAWWLYWRIPGATNTTESHSISSPLKVSFQWTDKKEGGLWRSVESRVLPEDPTSPAKNIRRTCDLIWEASKTAATTGIVANEKCSLDPEVSDGSCSTTGTHSSNITRTAKLYLDSQKSYDWFRFRFLEFAEVVAKRIEQKVMHDALNFNSTSANSNSPITVYDPVAGACWFPLLVKTKLPHLVHPICSDISSDAVAVARDNFKMNNLLEENNDVTLLTGCCFWIQDFGKLRVLKYSKNVTFYPCKTAL